MPNQKICRKSDFSKYDCMSDEELEEILRSDIQNTRGEESDTDFILYIMGALADRETCKHGKSAEEAFQSFQENYYSCGKLKGIESSNSAEEVHKPKKKTKLLQRAFTAAAMIALVLLTTLTAYGSQYDLWGKLANWTQEVFRFGENYDKRDGEPADYYGLIFDSLREALEKKNISTDILPTWLPDGYESSDINIIESPESVMVIAAYQNSQGKEITIQIKEYANKHVLQIEKDENTVIQYNVKGIEFFVFNNYEQHRAVWYDGQCECIVSGDLQLDELYAILDSFEREE